MYKKFLIWLMFALAVYVVQSSFLPLIHYNGIGPDLFLLITGSFAFQKGSRMGSFMGFVLGLFQDLATGTFFGFNTFSKLLAGYGCGIFSSRVIRDNFMLPISASVVSTSVCYFILMIIMLMMGYRFNPLVHMTMNLIPLLCYNAVFAWPIHYMVRRIIEKTADK